MKYIPGQHYRFSYAMAIAILLHGLLLFWVTFVAVSTMVSESKKEVTLSQMKSEERPDEAEFLAKHHQQGSGTDAAKSEELTTIFSPIFLDAMMKEIRPIVLPEESLATEQVVKPRIVITIGDSPYTVNLDDTDLHDSLDDVSDGNAEQKNLAELSHEIASLEARLKDKQQQSIKNPRVLVLTSTSAIAADDADYVHQWRDRVETVGNLNYPEEARARQLYGDVRLMVRLNANGVVEQVTIKSSSGHQILDKAAMDSIRLASPFEPFPEELAAKYDRIDVIRTWQFKKNRLHAKAG